MDDSDFSSELQDRLADRRTGDAEGALNLSDEDGYVGDELTIRGREFPTDETYDLVWQTSDGEWAVIGANRVVGPQYQPRAETITTVRTDEQGAFETNWTVPEDYGGTHKITLRNGDSVLARTEFEVRPWFEIDRTEAPIGDAFVVRGYGIGPSVESNNFQIAWDNQFVGFVTGVRNSGTATAQVRAVGPPGKHVIQVWRNYRGVPFVANNTQSPLGSVGGDRANAWTVEVTEPAETPPAAWVDTLFEESPIEAHYPELDADTDAELDVTPQYGQTGTQAIITGRRFPARTEVDLKWYQHVGEGIRGLEVTPTVRPRILPAVTTDADGRFQVEFEVPPAEGSTRPILAEVDGQSVAATGFMMQPSIETFEPTSGPVGTEIEIELSGIGWTAYESAPFFVYDNAPLGYACGASEDLRSPTVRTVLQATGEPGHHFIDVYPSLFEMEDDEPEFEIRPHLSYLDNHPVRRLPACHMTFEVTPE